MPDPVQHLIAKRDFSKAIETLQAQARARPHLRRPRLKLADVYLMAGREREAVPELLTLADQFAGDGFIAKAIAMLKRVEKIEPGRRDVEVRLAELIRDKSHRAVPRPGPGISSGIAFGLEVIEPSAEIHLGVPDTPVTPPPAPTSTRPVEFDDTFSLDADPDEDEAEPKPDLSTPLFDGLSPEELVAVMHGLKLVSFEPGDLIMVEGEEGDSMLILTSGKVKAYVRTPSGKSTKVQEFEEGDFFGEIAVLTGKPRTATLTAAEPCDCLELDRATLDEITQTHPRIREVLREFQEMRARSTVQVIMADGR